MAKSSAPFLSLDARGSIAGAITAVRRGTRRYMFHAKPPRRRAPTTPMGYGLDRFAGAVYGFAGPAASRTLSQVQGARRFSYSAGVGVYNALTAPEKALLSVEAKVFRITGFNLFMRNWLP